MRRLLIAEKPDMGRKIAACLGGERAAAGTSYINCQDGWVVAWVVGHILQQKEPEAYLPESARQNWAASRQHLPIIPEQGAWQLEPVDGKQQLLKGIEKLLKQTDEVVHAGDAGSEGQLLIDEVLQFLGWRGKTSRLWISALNRDSIVAGLATLKSNDEKRGLSLAALARSRADWLMGFNFTRAATLSTGESRVMVPVGRVKTPTLSLVCERDAAIRNFVPHSFYGVEAEISLPNGMSVKAKWLPDVTRTKCDPEGRCLDKQTAQGVESRARVSLSALVKHVEKKTQTEDPPLLFNQTALAKRLSFLRADEVLAASQAVYDASIQSYPRSPCRYAPSSMRIESAALLPKLASIPWLAHATAGANPKLVSKVWDDAKMEGQDHHGLLPASECERASELQGAERAVFEVVALNFIAQFYPPCKTDCLKIGFDIAGEKFEANIFQVLEEGWKKVFKTDDADLDDVAVARPGVSMQSPAVGDSGRIQSARLSEGTTTPPMPYTEGELMTAMEAAHRWVKDQRLKALMQQRGVGLGTEATRASTISELVRQGCLLRGKQGSRSIVTSTRLGQHVIEKLPPILSDVGLSAQWQAALALIEMGQSTYDKFMDMQHLFVMNHTKQLLSAPIDFPEEVVMEFRNRTNSRPQRRASRR